MADDRNDDRRRMEDERQRGQGQGGYGQPQHGQTYGQAGGYSQSYGQNQPVYGGQTYGGGQDRTQGFSGGGQYGGQGGGYTGQTGTGYGQTWGGEQDTGRRHESLWERTKDAVGSAVEGAERRLGHRGRGPKNYTRSDDRIREDVNDRLTDDQWLDASDIEIAVASAEVTLTGTVESRDDKRRAEDLADSVSGVKHVQNNLRVRGREGERRGLSDLFSNERMSGTGEVG